METLVRKKLLTWLGNLLWPYFVPMEDYEYVQERCDRAERENMELMDHVYATKYSYFELLDPNALICERQTFNDIALRRMVFQWYISIPERRFYTTWSVTKELDVIANDVSERLAKQFRDRIRKELFKP